MRVGQELGNPPAPARALLSLSMLSSPGLISFLGGNRAICRAAPAGRGLTVGLGVDGSARWLQDAVGCCRMLWDAVGCCEILWDAVGCYGMLWDAAGCCSAPVLRQPHPPHPPSPMLSASLTEVLPFAFPKGGSQGPLHHGLHVLHLRVSCRSSSRRRAKADHHQQQQQHRGVRQHPGPRRSCGRNGSEGGTRARFPPLAPQGSAGSVRPRPWEGSWGSGDT